MTIKVQGDRVNCGVWVIWMGWIWIGEAAQRNPDFMGISAQTMAESDHNVHDLLAHNTSSSERDRNLQYALHLRQTLRVTLNPTASAYS